MFQFFFDYWPVIAAVFGTLGVGGVAVLIIGWPVVSAFLIGTRAGRWILVAAFVALALLLFATTMKRKGAAAERARQAARALLTAQKRIRKDESIRNLPRADLERRFKRWLRP